MDRLDSGQCAYCVVIHGLNQVDLFDAVGNAPPKRITAAAGTDFIEFRPA